MSRLVWGAVGSRVYELGVDRGVLFPPAGADGVPWNGLVSVKETPDGGQPQAYYKDGVKYLQIASAEEFKATIEAFSAPPEFALCDGIANIFAGLAISQQPRKAFGFSYRTLIGSDIAAEAHGYKLHLVYNALAYPAGREYASLSDSIDLVDLSWVIETVPPAVTGFKPSAHLVISSPTNLQEQIHYIWNGLANDSTSTRTDYIANSTVTSLATNPSFEKADGTKTVRTNLITNPNFEVDTSTWNRYGAASTISRETSGGPQGNAHLRMTINTVGIGGFYGGDAPAVPSVLLTASAWVRSNVSQRVSLGIEHRSETASIRQDLGAEVVLAANTWTLIDVAAASAPTGTTSTRILAGVRSGTGQVEWAVGDTFDMDLVLLEKSPTIGTYFDYSTPAAGDFSYASTGVANESTSIQTAPGVAGASSYKAVSVQSSEWLSSGTKSVRTIAVEATNDSVTYPAGTSGMTLGMQAEKTYTVLVRCRLAAPLTGTLNIHSRCIVIQYNDGLTTFLPSDPAPNTAGVHDLRFTFTLPAGTTGAFIYLSNGSSAGNGDVWWDNLLVVEGVYTGEYFDGSTPDTPGGILAAHLTAVENIVYGLEGGQNARQPTVAELITIFGS